MIPLLLACREPDPAPSSGVVLNEVLARNDAGWADPDGTGECVEHDDWIELFNRGRDPVDLGGYALVAGGERFVLPGVRLEPGAHLLVVADEEPEQGALHAPFGVSADGEVIDLVGPDGRVLDRVDVPSLAPDVSFGRYGDGGGAWRALATASPGAPNETPPDDSCLSPRAGFDDHTTPCIGTVEGFAGLASARAGLEVVKFEVLGWQDEPHPVFLDSRFYALHDEWYLFRMLNGQPVEGEDQFAPFPGEFATIGEIYDWASTVDVDSLFPSAFVSWTDTGRLTSWRFYDLALGDVRVIGAGTLVHAPARDGRDERWAFELEYSDDPTHDELVTFFETLTGRLGPELGDELRWLVRSPVQEALAADMEARGLAYGDRLLRYADLAAPGEVEVYRGGTVAGRVRVIRAGEDGLEDATEEDVLVLEEIPDWLPPCAALITSVPQTPLAHVALLAESRGIPNLYVAGITSDPLWDSLGRLRLPVAIRATTPDGFEAVELTPEELATWSALSNPAAPEIVATDPEAWPWTLDLEAVPIAEMESWRPGFGGKNVGMVALLDTPGVDTPDRPLGIGIRAYAAHLAQLDWLDDLLAAPEFADPGDARIRFLVLEGRTAYDERYPEPGDAIAADAWLAAHADVLGDLARADGVRGAIASAPLPAEVADEVLPVVRARYDELAAEQGLRFRSSSNVEDAEGFNGAGLYESNTGFPDEEGSVEDALRATWASYWGAYAFEERHRAGIDHAAGAMAVLVHPNFDDDDEVSNGVVTATVMPDGSWTVQINAQLGALSVTNPPVDACRTILPEVVRVVDGAIERLQPSTETDEVLDDARVLALDAMARPVVSAWLDVLNGALPPEQVRSTLTLDFEYREVVDGWPHRDDGAGTGQRLVLKQARPLEPSLAALPDDVRAEPFPRDLLARARIVDEVACGTVTATIATTDPTKTPDMGHGEVPFVAEVVVDGVALTWLDLSAAAVDEDGVAVVTTPEAAARTGIAEVDADGPCVVTTLWAAPDTYLDDLLDAE